MDHFTKPVISANLANFRKVGKAAVWRLRFRYGAENGRFEPVLWKNNVLLVQKAVS